MKYKLTVKNCSHSTQLNRYAYGLYMILAIYFIIEGDYAWAFTNLGVALVFDPFDTTVKWQHRPLYQKSWLFVHAAVMLAGLIYLCFQKHWK